jgi:hypothetical protein
MDGCASRFTHIISQRREGYTMFKLALLISKTSSYFFSLSALKYGNCKKGNLIITPMKPCFYVGDMWLSMDGY